MWREKNYYIENITKRILVHKELNVFSSFSILRGVRKKIIQSNSAFVFCYKGILGKKN